MSQGGVAHVDDLYNFGHECSYKMCFKFISRPNETVCDGLQSVARSAGGVALSSWSIVGFLFSQDIARGRASFPPGAQDGVAMLTGRSSGFALPLRAAPGSLLSVTKSNRFYTVSDRARAYIGQTMTK